MGTQLRPQHPRISTVARKKTPPAPEPPANPWPARLRALQERLHLDNHDMAARLDVSLRAYQSWKWGERRPSPAQARLIEQFIASLPENS